MDNAQIKKSLVAVKATIDAAQEAIIALTAGQMESYTLDTGQTRQTVTKANIPQMQQTINSLMSQCDVLEARLNGGGFHVRSAC